MTDRARHSMPLYPDEQQVARAVMGPERARDWPNKAKYLEDKHGLPRVDELMGGRFWPAVVEYFRVRHGIPLPDKVDGIPNSQPNGRIRVVPFRPDGKEDFNVPEAQASAGRRPRSRHHRSGL